MVKGMVGSYVRVNMMETVVRSRKVISDRDLRAGVRVEPRVVVHAHEMKRS